MNKFQEKEAQKRISKKVHSANIRQKRIMMGSKINPAFCNECGFRIRSENHLEGAHHNNCVASCHRGR